MAADQQRFPHERPEAPTAAELAVIPDLPALCRAETTTRQERQTIARLLLERVAVTVIGDSEQVRLERHLQGGNRTALRMVRTVAKLKALSAYPELVARAGELHRAGRNCVAIAAILNGEGWRPPKRRDTFNGPMAPRVLVGAGLIGGQPRDLEGGPSPSPGRIDDQRTRRRNRGALGHDIPPGSGKDG